MQEYSFINLFRALAALWVLAAHCMIWGGWYGIPLPSPKLAVDLFMIISGYLMAANAYHREKFEPLSTFRNWCRFVLRRFFRLAPGYYLSLALAVGFSTNFLTGYSYLQQLNPEHWLSDIYNPSRIEYTAENIFLHLSFLFGLHPTYSFSTFLPDWSLSLEMQFYVIFPALMLTMRKHGFIRSSVLIGTVSVLSTVILERVVQYYEPSLLLFKLPYFIAGMLLYNVVCGSESRKERAIALTCSLVLVSTELKYGHEMICLPLLLLWMYFLGWMEQTKEMPKWVVAVMDSRAVRFASDCSYSVYLFHGFFLSACGLIIAKYPQLLALTPPCRVGLIFLFVATLTYAMSYVTFRLVELPGIRLGKRLTQLIVPLGRAAVPSQVEQQSELATGISSATKAVL